MKYLKSIIYKRSSQIINLRSNDYFQTKFKDIANWRIILCKSIIESDKYLKFCFNLYSILNFEFLINFMQNYLYGWRFFVKFYHK